MKTLVIVAAALALGTAPALAQSKTSPMPQTSGGKAAQPAASAQNFAKTVAISDMFEVQSSKLAADKARNAELKKFAEHMVEAHSKTSKELASMVSGSGTTTGSRSAQIELPKDMDAKHKQKLQMLQSKSGAEFDKAYREAQIEAHKEAVSQFQSYSQSGDNAELKSWAAKTLPDLKEHLQMIQGIKLSS